MIRGSYELHENIWCLHVNGKVKAGDIVEVSRSNNTVHRHTVAEVIMTAKGRRLCTIVPVTRERLKDVYGTESLPHPADQGSARLR